MVYLAKFVQLDTIEPPLPEALGRGNTNKPKNYKPVTLARPLCMYGM
jgi:hypothetical protein